MNQEKITQEERAVLREARLKLQLATQEVELIQLKIFLEHQLKQGDGFDLETGIITRRPAPSEHVFAEK